VEGWFATHTACIGEQNMWFLRRSGTTEKLLEAEHWHPCDHHRGIADTEFPCAASPSLMVPLMSNLNFEHVRSMAVLPHKPPPKKQSE
jgi:hypothetical protein